ncbi:MAG: hypothetical protein IPJ13_02160 [Saprospiraceae bacterium]|nr:hypothetical protein [Saprospiraceae bacterium]
MCPYSFKAQALGEITPGPMVGNTSHVFIPKMFLIFLAGLCLIIILSAGFNYTNLTLARSFTRAKKSAYERYLVLNGDKYFTNLFVESVVISFGIICTCHSIVVYPAKYIFKICHQSIHQYYFEHDPSLYLIFIGFSILIEY